MSSKSGLPAGVLPFEDLISKAQKDNTLTIDKLQEMMKTEDAKMTQEAQQYADSVEAYETKLVQESIPLMAIDEKRKQLMNQFNDFKSASSFQEIQLFMKDVDTLEKSLSQTNATMHIVIVRKKRLVRDVLRLYADLNKKVVDLAVALFPQERARLEPLKAFEAAENQDNFGRLSQNLSSVQSLMNSLPQ